MPHTPRWIDPGPLEQFTPPALSSPSLRPTQNALYIPLNEVAAPSGVSRVIFGGDWAAVREFSEIADSEPSSLYGALHDRIRNADLAVVNLECPLGGDDPIPKDGPNFRCEPSCAAALSRGGFHVATLANNHIFDQGASGLRATLKACHDAGLMTVGAGGDIAHAGAPLFVKAGGHRIGLLALADTEEGMAGRESGGAAPVFEPHTLDRCRQLAHHADIAIVIVHGGKEYAPVPPPYWYEQLTTIAATGVDAVIGHHPHVPQGLILADGPGAGRVPVVFSTGNFIFPPREPTAVMSAWMSLGYMVELQLTGTGIAALELVPYRIDPPVGIRGFRGGQIETFAQFIEQVSGPLSEPDRVEAWFNAAVDYFWEQQWRRRVEGLTRKLCRDDQAGLQHGRSHFRSRPHATLIDRTIERKLHGTFGNSPASITQPLKQWFKGTWPVVQGELYNPES